MDNGGSASDTSSPSEQSSSAPKAPPAPTSIGGMTLKKRAPSDKPAATTAAPALVTRAGGAAGAPRTGGAFGRPTGPSPNAQKRMERFSRVMPTRDPGVRMNENIRVPEIRVIGADGGQIGVMSPREALEIARSKGLDLIEIVPNAQPPVCKIIDFGKWKYEQQKKDKLAKKSSHQQLLKEIRFHPRTDTHDFEFKVRHARTFLSEGHKVKAYVQFKGREVAYKQFGEELLNNFKARLEDLAKVDQNLSMMGRMMSMVLSPSGKKKPVEKKGEGKAASKSKGVVKDEVEELGPDFTESIDTEADDLGPEFTDSLDVDFGSTEDESQTEIAELVDVQAE